MMPNVSETEREPFSKTWLFTVVLCSLLGLATGYSSTYFYTSGLFLIPIATDFEISRAQASLGPLACMLVHAAVTPFLGQMLDRFGAFSVAVLSLVGLAVGFLLLATLTQGLASYIGCLVVLALLGSGSTALSFSRLVLDAFDRRRGVALGFVMTGTGLGALVFPPLLMSIIEESGWRSAYLLLAAVALVATMVISMLLFPIRRKLKPYGLAATRSAARGAFAIWRDKSFHAIGIMFLLLGMASVSLVVHFVPILVGAGMTSLRAASIAGLIGLASIGGRILMGFLLDRYPVTHLTIGVIILAGMGIALMIADPLTFGIFAALMLGVAMGSEADLLAFFALRYFPEESYGKAFGGILCFFLIGCAIGPSTTAHLYDLTGGYTVPLLGVVGVFFLALLAALRLPRPESEQPNSAPR
jgi:MFS family permease